MRKVDNELKELEELAKTRELTEEEKSRWKKCKAVINGLKRFEENPGEILASTVFRFCDCCTVCIKCGKVSKKGGKHQSCGKPRNHMKVRDLRVAEDNKQNALDSSGASPSVKELRTTSEATCVAAKHREKREELLLKLEKDEKKE